MAIFYFVFGCGDLIAISTEQRGMDMKKKQIANFVMVMLILVIAAAGILTVGSIRGWFDRDGGEAAVLTDLRGILTMERDGVAYQVDADTLLRQGD